MASKKVLVTGGCGYIGSHVVRQLSERGETVVVVDDLSAGHREALINGETLHVVDIVDKAALDQVFARHEFDAVVHFAAKIWPPESVANPLLYYRNNVVGTLNLAEAAVRHGVKKFVFSSTCATYGQPKRMPVVETDPTAPESPYGFSKLMSEQILRDAAATHGLKVAILRYFNVAGADPEGRIGERHPDTMHLVKVACEVAVGKRAGMKINGTDYPTRDGTCIRDYIHVEDLADAHVSAVDYLRRGGDTVVLNCGYGKGLSVKEVVEMVRRVSGVDIKAEVGPRRAGDPAEVVAGADKIKQVLGWRPRFGDLKTIVEHAYRWEQHLIAEEKGTAR